MGRASLRGACICLRPPVRRQETPRHQLAQKGTDTMALELDDTQAAVLLASLGLPENTTDVQLVIDTVQDATRDPILPPHDAKPSEIAAAAARNGMEVIDKDTADALRRDAQEGRKIAAAAAKQRIEASV